MNYESQIAGFHEALEAGDMDTARRLANSIDWVAAAPVIPPRVIDTTAADNVARRSPGLDFEGMILARDERMMHAFI
jgi:hypothetical protein